MIDRRLQALHHALARRPPRLIQEDATLVRAAVCLLIRPAEADLEVLLIQRPISEKDPWSGHMALPGGRQDGAEQPLDTAIREAREEVGIDLCSRGVLLGRLDDVRPSRGGPQIAVSPFVLAVPTDIRVSPQPGEVAGTIWIPTQHLADPAMAAEHLHVMPGGATLRFPALEYHGHIIWGLTYRMLMQFLEILRSIRQEETS